jgi:molybdopterin-guanine dinucleotide biosynthesis protein A
MSAEGAWHPDVSALILAGGKATRFGGIAKHALVIDGQTILERQLALLRPRVTEVIVSLPAEVSTFPAASVSSEPIDSLGPTYRIVRDRTPDVGPLAGVVAGLSECRTNWLLVVAGDMPHLAGDLIDRMLLVVEDALEQELGPQDERAWRASLAASAAQSASLAASAAQSGFPDGPGGRATSDGDGGVDMLGARAMGGVLDAVGVKSRGLPEPLLCVLHRRVLPVVAARISGGRYKASGLLTDEGLRVAWIDHADPRALRNVNSPEDL